MTDSFDKGISNPLHRSTEVAGEYWQSHVLLGNASMPVWHSLTAVLERFLEQDGEGLPGRGGPWREGLSNDLVEMSRSLQKLVEGEERLSVTEIDQVVKGPTLLDEYIRFLAEGRKSTASMGKHWRDGLIQDEDICEVLQIQNSELAWLVEIKIGFEKVVEAINQERAQSIGHLCL